MPNAAHNYQGMAAPQDGPFSEYLKPYQPRALDRVPPPGSATGYEATPAAAGNLALQFLQNMRQERMARAMESDANVQKQVDSYRDIVGGHLGPDSELTLDAQPRLGDLAHDVMVKHMQHEMNDIPKGDGLLGGIKNVFVALSGGPIKVREPIHWPTERGRLDEFVRTPENTKSHWRNAAAAKMGEALNAMNGYTPAGRVAAAAQKVAGDLDLVKRLGQDATDKWVVSQTVGHAPSEGFLREKVQGDIYDRMYGKPAGPPTSPPPPAQVERQQSEPLAGLEVDPDVDLQSDAGRYIMANLPQKTAAAPMSFSAPAAAPQTAPPPAPGGMPIDRMRQDMERSIMGYPLGKPTTLYNMDKQGEVATNVQFDPSHGGYVWADTRQPIPANMNKWVPEDQVKWPQADRERDFDFRDANKKFVTIRMRVGDNGAYSPVQIAGQPPIDISKYEFVGPTQLPVMIGPGTGTLTPRTEAIGGVAPSPQEAPGSAEQHRIQKAAEALMGKALQAHPASVNDQLAFIAQNGGGDATVVGKAYDMLGRPTPPDKIQELIKMFMGGGAASGTPTAAPPAAQSPPPANNVPLRRVPEQSGGARGLIRRQ